MAFCDCLTSIYAKNTLAFTGESAEKRGSISISSCKYLLLKM